MIFFTADQHFGHANIIKYCDRPFADVGEMDEELIRRWNETVEPGDQVHHLGDFTLGDKARTRHYFSRLNGAITVLANRWHHDRRWLSMNVDKTLKSKSNTFSYVNVSPPLVVLEFPKLGDGKYPQTICLCHYPLAEWDRKHHGAQHLHGHSHGKHWGEGLILDVGVDCRDFRHVSLDDVAKLMAAKRPEEQ